MAANIIIVIIVTSLATYLSRFLGVVSAEKIKETSKMFSLTSSSNIFCKLKMFQSFLYFFGIFLSDPSPIIGYPCQ